MTETLGRHGRNVSQYIAQLNTIYLENELLPDPFEIDITDFSAFINEDFIGCDAGSMVFNPDDSALDFDYVHAEQSSHIHTRRSSVSRGGPQLKIDDFTLADGDLQYAELNFLGLIGNQPIQHLQSWTSAYPIQYSHNSQNSPVSIPLSPVAPLFYQSDEEHKLTIETNRRQAVDEAARIAEWEDLRRRNTAASARFRTKKKQRVQALEKTAKEVSNRTSVLEVRIQQLEIENTWLKSVLAEKNDSSKPTLDISPSLKRNVEENADEGGTSGHTDGVGIEAKVQKVVGSSSHC